MDSAPVAIDLFCGAGFMGLGFAQAGFDVRFGVDSNPETLKIHRRNFPNIPVSGEDIRNVGASLIRGRAGLRPGEEVDVVFGGPPCTGFSVQGHKREDDPRRNLIFEFERIVGAVRPKHFVLENVKGLTSGRDREVLEKLIHEFDLAGYDCAEPWQVLNAKDYGVAQNRERLFLLGSRRDRPIIKYPIPQQKRVTVGEVLYDLEDRAIAAMMSGGTITQHTAAVQERFQAVGLGKREPISKFHRLHPNGFSPTLTSGTVQGSDRGGRHTPKRPIHYAEDRCCTVRELARLHGIPDYITMGRPYDSVASAASAIGNSVPPPLAKAVAEQVMKAIENFENWRS